jgi:hypothetical protein
MARTRPGYVCIFMSWSSSSPGIGPRAVIALPSDSDFSGGAGCRDWERTKRGHGWIEESKSWFNNAAKMQTIEIWRTTIPCYLKAIAFRNANTRLSASATLALITVHRRIRAMFLSRAPVFSNPPGAGSNLLHVPRRQCLGLHASLRMCSCNEENIQD